MRNRILLISMILLLPLLISGCKTKATIKKDSVKNVKVMTVGKSDIVSDNEFAGSIKPVEETDVVSKMSGKVSQVFVDIGSRVSQGQLLFTLDSTDVNVQLQQAQAGVDIAKANLNRVKGSSFSQSNLQSQSAYDQAKLAYDDAKRNYDRVKVLYQEGAASKVEYDSAQSRMNQTKQQMDTASRNADLFNSGLGPDSIEAAQAQYNQAVASLQMVQQQLENLKVYAPMSGVISKRNINPGEASSPATPALVIANTDRLVAELSIPERLINKLKSGQKLSIIVDSLNGKTFDGVVGKIDPVADPKSHNYLVRVELYGKGTDLKPGMFAKIKMGVENKKDVITVPNQAVLSESGTQFVYITKDNKVVKQPVTVGLSNSKITEITQGLNVGDNLVTEGQSFLSDGEAVNIVK